MCQGDVCVCVLSAATSSLLTHAVPTSAARAQLSNSAPVLPTSLSVEWKNRPQKRNIPKHSRDEAMALSPSRTMTKRSNMAKSNSRPEHINLPVLGASPSRRYAAPPPPLVRPPRSAFRSVALNSTGSVAEVDDNEQCQMHKNND